MITDQLGQVGALAPGGGAGIQQPLTRPGLQQGGDPLGGAVLDAPVAFGVAGQGPQVAAAGRERQSLGQPLQRFGGDAGGGEGLQQSLPADAQGVDPQIQGWRLVAGGGEGFGPLLGQPAE